MYDLTTEKLPDGPKNFNAFIEEASGDDELAIVQFSAPWCGPCRTLSATLTPYSEKLEQAADGRPAVKLGKINVDEYPDLASYYNVRGLPTVLFFRRGLVVHELRTGVTTGKIQQLVESLTTDQEDEF
jgi:thioredoxin 1